MEPRATTIQWVGIGTPSRFEGIQALTVNPDTQVATEGAPEWLVTNGLGGYACGTMSGLVTRRFHGYLVAALPSPRGRVMMLNHLREVIELDGNGRAKLSEQPDPDAIHSDSAELREFRLDLGLPVWLYEYRGHLIEKRLVMPHRQNTVFVTYRRTRGEGPLRLTLDPWIHFRPHEGPLSGPIEDIYAVRAIAGRYEIEDTGDVGLPPLKLQMFGGNGKFAINDRRIRNVRYQVEQSRGYDASGDLYSPGSFVAALEVGETVALVASVEDWRTIQALTPEQAVAAERMRRERLIEISDPALHTSVGSELVLAADQFIINPAGRLEDAATAHATGDEERTIIAGYHWFTDWGRDTMISLEGLTLCTGREQEAGYILRTFAKYLKDGLIPNMFPEGKGEGLYHTADATLWFFHAVSRYVAKTGDHDTLHRLLPAMRHVIDMHERGTRFGIGVDGSDGLLRQGALGYQLTWMDAKVGDLVVTPRRGKAVEINALWYNALRLMEGWARTELHDDAAAKHYHDLAERTYASFNERFWNDRAGCLFDVVDGDDGDDPAIRPNQLFAIAMPFPVLDHARWKPVLDTVRTKLMTPFGLRSLSPDHPDYQPQYFGDLRARDLAYHQGTVWPWLIGPYYDACVRVYPDKVDELLPMLKGLGQSLASACIGSISEIYDAEAPYTPRGCCAQAWSVAEVLRVLAAIRTKELAATATQTHAA